MDSPSRAELKSTLNELKAKSKKSMFIKHIKRMYGGGKKNLNAATSVDVIIPEAEPPKSLVDNDNHVDSTSNLNHRGGDNNTADLSKSSIESNGSYIKVVSGAKKGRPKKHKIDDPAAVSTPPSSSTSSPTSPLPPVTPQVISTIDEVIELENPTKRAPSVEVEVLAEKNTSLLERSEVANERHPEVNEVVQQQQPESNSEIVISKITKESEIEFEKFKNKALSQYADENTVGGKTPIEVEEERVATPEPVTTTSTIQQNDLINDDSKDETELILSQSKTFLRKSSKRNSSGITPVNTSPTPQLDARDRSIIEPFTSKTNGVKGKPGRKAGNYKGKRKAHVKNNKENSKPKVQQNKANDGTTIRKNKRKMADDDEPIAVDDPAVEEQQPQKRTSTRTTKNIRSKSIRASAMKILAASAVAQPSSVETHRPSGKRSKASNKEIIEIAREESESNRLRRSPRMKTSRSNPEHLKPIYVYEFIKDFTGKRISIQKITGFKQIKSDLAQFRAKFWLKTNLKNKRLKRQRHRKESGDSTRRKRNKEKSVTKAKQFVQVINLESKRKRQQKEKEAKNVNKEKSDRAIRALNRRNSEEDQEVDVENVSNSNEDILPSASAAAGASADNEQQMDNPSIEIVNDDFIPLANSSIDEEITTTTTAIVKEIIVAAAANAKAINRPTTIKTESMSSSDAQPKIVKKSTATVSTNTLPVVVLNELDNEVIPVNSKKSQSTDYLSDSFEDLYNNELYEHTNEIVNVEENLQAIPRNVVRFHQLVDQKEYTELSHGVFATVIGPTEGIIRIDQLQNTITNEHDSDIHYYVQKGYITLKLNDKNILMTIGDAILIPKCNRYELFNPSKKQQAYILFKFDKL